MLKIGLRRMASVFSANGRYANSFGEGAPLRSTPASNGEFRVVAQSRFGVTRTCLKPFIGFLIPPGPDPTPGGRDLQVGHILRVHPGASGGGAGGVWWLRRFHFAQSN